MCGIVGIASLNEIINKDLLISMRDSMTHRGPDDAGLWCDNQNQVGLAHRRLSIIDLSERGHQPMTDASGKYWIVFNGEIYNYRQLRKQLKEEGHHFKTASDTEVILAAYCQWGQNCLAYFNGMFAFALYDTTNDKLFVARDRAGQKPLFFYHTKGRFVFASELKAIMTDPSFERKLNPIALNFYLTYGYVPGEMCILKRVHKLPPGHSLTYYMNSDCLRIQRYWQLPAYADGAIADADELTEQIYDLLKDSVRMRLRADVPVGILLSGGVDSSLVTALASQVSADSVKTFTISFPGHGKYDESPHARIVAEHFGTEHIEMEVEPATIDLLPQLARQFDEPIADSSMIPTYLVSRLIRQHAKVALGGDGGDELFGGYQHHSWVQQQQCLRGFIPHQIAKMVSKGATKLMPHGMKGRNYILGCLSDLQHNIAQANIYFDSAMRQRLLAPVWPNANFAQNRPEAYKVALCRSNATPLQLSTSVDFVTYLPEDIMVKVDRASMLTSLEIRSPFLDHRIIEFAFNEIPDKLRATLWERKILVRKIAQQLLPPQLNLKRKQGFSIPLQEWFKGRVGNYFEQVLRQTDNHIFNQTVINKLIQNQHRGFLNSQRLFSLVIFELWRTFYKISI
jgi:asparagine synthase (glutamine-hydrolysing)